MKLKALLTPAGWKRTILSLNEKSLCRLFSDYARIKEIPQHLDIINVGSNPGKFGLDYSDSDVKGFNLAVGPQTIEYDYRMIKNYHSFLDDNGPKLLLLLFCPFSLCKFRYTDKDGSVSNDLRYYPILHHSQINNYSESVYTKWKKKTIFQVLKSPTLLKQVICNKNGAKLAVDHNPLDTTQMIESGRNYIEGWKKEFELINFEVENLPLSVKMDIEKNSKILDEIIEFCEERDIKPIFVLPPVSKPIMSHIPIDFRNLCLYSILKSKNIPLLDYTDDQVLTKDENFVDALCLNAQGRKKFTQEVISKLRELKILTK